MKTLTEPGVMVGGRVRKPYTTVRAYKGGATVRVDDEQNLAFWLEIDLSVGVLEALLARAKALRLGVRDERD